MFIDCQRESVRMQSSLYDLRHPVSNQDPFRRERESARVSAWTRKRKGGGGEQRRASSNIRTDKKSHTISLPPTCDVNKFEKKKNGCYTIIPYDNNNNPKRYLFVTGSLVYNIPGESLCLFRRETGSTSRVFLRNPTKRITYIYIRKNDIDTNSVRCRCCFFVRLEIYRDGKYFHNV